MVMYRTLKKSLMMMMTTGVFFDSLFVLYFNALGMMHIFRMGVKEAHAFTSVYFCCFYFLISVKFLFLVLTKSLF